MSIPEFSGKSRGEFRGELILLVTALIWGLSFVAQRSAAATLGPFTFNAWRYLVAFLCVLPVILLRKKTARVDFNITVLGAFLLAAVLFGGSSFQQAGLGYTTAGKSGFITGLYVILVPLFGLFLKKKPSPAIWIGAILAVLGLYLLSVGDISLKKAGWFWVLQSGDSFPVGKGELLTLGSALFWAFQILLNSYFASRVDILLFTAVQFCTVALLSFGVGIPLEGFTLPRSPDVWMDIIYTGLFANAVAFILQLEGQKRAHPARASIIMSTESLFAAIGGILILGEPLTSRTTKGGLLIFAGIIIAQVNFPLLKRKKQGS